MNVSEFRQPDGGQVTVHQCPGCELWQVDYDFAAVWDFLTVRTEGPMSAELRIFASYDAWRDEIEAILRDHLAECPDLWAVVADAGLDPATLVRSS
jgi:hypothetical protein